MACDFDTIAKRLKLADAKKPRWETLIQGVALGYRKQPNTTRWLVRYKDPNASNPKNPYAIEAFGYPDDAVNIDAGRDVMDYDAAQDAAKKVGKARRQAEPTGPTIITVGTVVERYIKMRDERDRALGRRASRSDANIRLTKYVMSHSVAEVRLRDLTRKHLSDWRNALEGEFTTRRRLVNDFKAALNSDFVVEDYENHLPTGYSDIVKTGLALKAKNTPGAKKASSRPIQVLTDSQFTAVMTAAKEIDTEDGWEGDLYRLIVALASTGMRFSQLTRMTVGDTREHDFSILVPPSLKGGDVAFEKQDPIKRLMAESDFRILRPKGDNRPEDSPLLERWRNEQSGYDKETRRAIWTKVSRGPWYDAAEIVRPWAKIRKRAGLPDGFVPYAFRHTSIVRMLDAHLPAGHVAALHNTSEKMLQSHYAKHIVDALTELERGIVRGVAA